MFSFPFSPIGTIAAVSSFPSVGDFNNDGLVENFGTINNGNGTFSSAPLSSIQTILANYPGRVNRDARALDINGDGNLDVFWNVYSDPSLENSFALILYGDGTGAFPTFEERRDVDGFGETIVAADFNNDGLVDVFSPVYTHVLGSDANFLLFNTGGVLGTNQAVEFGVALSNQPAFLRVEGSQGADFNFDGWIDIFTSSRLFINQQTFFSETVLDPQVFDEGINLLDYDNDGDFDLALRTEFGGVKLYEWTGSAFVFARDLTEDADTPGVGLNSYDIDLNGWEDLVLSSPTSTTVLFNQGGVFEAVTAASPEFDAFAFADLNQDGRVDLVGAASTGSIHLFENISTGGASIRLSVLGSNGEQNQQGRSILLTSQDQPGLVLARSVESGSGYLSQSQYEKIIGLPVSGAYSANVALATGAYEFTVSAGQGVRLFSDGRVEIDGSYADEALGGGIGADTLAGLGGTDLFIGTEGTDQIDGGSGSDTVDYSGISEGILVNLTSGTAQILSSTQNIASVENVIGTDFDDDLSGGSESNLILGGGGADRIDGKGGVDDLRGGMGNDVFVVDDIGDLVTELANQGYDTVDTNLAEYVLPANIEAGFATSATAQELAGNTLDNAFSGTIGGHSFLGGAGDDRFIVKAGDSVIEAENEGRDSVETELATYVLPDNVEVLSGTATNGQELRGNAFGNELEGAATNDVLVGLAGDDRYIVSSGDSVVEALDEGADIVMTALSFYVLPDNVESLTGTSLVAQTLQGNALDNFIRGRAIGNSFAGGDGNDTYFVNRSDVVTELANQGTDEVITALQTYTLPQNAENLTGTAANGQKLVGNAANNVIKGGAGVDTFFGLDGDDTYYVDNLRDFVIELPNQGYDRVFTSVSYSLGSSAIAAEELSAADLFLTDPLFLEGNSLDNRITGNAGNNILDGGAGNDVLFGLGGDDVYVIDSVGDQVVEAAGGGNDRIAAMVSYQLAANVAVEVLGTRNNVGTDAINLTGNNLANTVIGNAGNNILDGGGGQDRLVGFGGDDTYRVDSADDLVAEDAGGGQDRVIVSAQFYALGINEEVEFLETSDALGTAPVGLTGNNLANSITGNAGNNILDGGGGNDVLIGLGGDDVYVIDSVGDQVAEAAGGGNDQIVTTVSYQLAANVSVEVLGTFNNVGTDAINLTGNNLVNTVIGNAGNNVLDGGGGNDRLVGFGGDDTYRVDSANDLVTEGVGGGQDRVIVSAQFYELRSNEEVEFLETSDALGTAPVGLTGNNLANNITGNAGNNILDGGAGNDVLFGLGGDDVYVIDSVGDQVVEAAGGGNDRIAAMVSYQLAANVAVEVLGTRNNVGTDAINLTGNNLANTVIGNAGNNILDGGGGNDVLFGLGGDDVYVIDSAGDQVVEAAGGGNDRIAAMVSYQLAANVAVEVLGTRNNVGTDAINLTGNNLANTVIGNAGNNILDGGAGNDVLFGLGGDDLIKQSSNAGKDFVDGGEGEDTFQLDGNSSAEVFNIYTRTAYLLVSPGTALNSDTEIVITRNGVAADNIVAELDNVEEISINTLNTTANDGNGVVNSSSVEGDTINVFGDFTQTSLNYSTISIAGSSANDTVNISGLNSAHRIVFNTEGGDDRVIGTLRPQDVVNALVLDDSNQLPRTTDTSVQVSSAIIDALSDFGVAIGPVEQQPAQDGFNRRLLLMIHDMAVFGSNRGSSEMNRHELHNPAFTDYFA